MSSQTSDPDSKLFSHSMALLYNTLIDKYLEAFCKVIGLNYDPSMKDISNDINLLDTTQPKNVRAFLYPNGNILFLAFETNDNPLNMSRYAAEATALAYKKSTESNVIHPVQIKVIYPGMIDPPKNSDADCVVEHIRLDGVIDGDEVLAKMQQKVQSHEGKKKN
jgi:hypothetical protein